MGKVHNTISLKLKMFLDKIKPKSIVTSFFYSFLLMVFIGFLLSGFFWVYFEVPGFHLIFFIFTLIILFIGLLVYTLKKINKNLDIFRNFFKVAATEATLIDLNLISFKETRKIAESANTMIKERQIVMDRLLESERRVYQIIDAANIPMAIGKDGNSEFLNKSFKETFGFTMEDMPTLEKMWELSYPDPVYREKSQKEWNAAIEDFSKGIGPFKKQYCTVRCKNGKDKDVEIDFSPVGERGLTTFRDLTAYNKQAAENVLLEKKLLRSQKMEAIGLMAGGVAHDLNNILSGIVGYPDLILMDLPEDSEIIPYLEAIKKSGLRAADVVADLLTIARGVASIRKPCNLNDIIDEYLESPEFERLKSKMGNIKIAKNFNKNLLNISCSEVHIKKSIMNLVMNAVEAMDLDGVLTIATKNQYVDTPFSMRQHIEIGEYVVLCVKDTGHGIKKEDRDRIFDPFYTKKVMGLSGTGLGLSVVWNTVKDHGGGVIVETSEKGSSFNLYFPAFRGKIPEDLQTEELIDINGSGETVLVIDDEPVQKEIATGMLKMLGYKPYYASSGKEAINWLESNKVDIILLDMIMPSGLNGLQTYRKIVEIHPGQKAVIASGYSQNKDVERTLELGAGRFIKKPYTIDALGKAMKYELGKKN